MQTCAHPLGLPAIRSMRLEDRVPEPPTTNLLAICRLRKRKGKDGVAPKIAEEVPLRRVQNKVLSFLEKIKRRFAAAGSIPRNRATYSLRHRTLRQEPVPHDCFFFLSQEHNSDLCRVTGMRPAATLPLQSSSEAQAKSRSHVRGQSSLSGQPQAPSATLYGGHAYLKQRRIRPPMAVQAGGSSMGTTTGFLLRSHYGRMRGESPELAAASRGLSRSMNGPVVPAEYSNRTGNCRPQEAGLSAAKTQPVFQSPTTGQSQERKEHRREQLLQRREVKRRILQELMKTNRIPPGYFLLGRQALDCAINFDLEDVVDKVNISANDEGEIVVKPEHIEGSLTSQGIVGRTVKYKPDKIGCRRAITITKASILEKPPQPAIRRAATSCAAGEGAEKKRSRQIRGESGAGKSVLGRIGPLCVPIPVAATEESRRRVAALLSKARIKIWHESDDHLVAHPINRAIDLINEITSALFRPKEHVVDQRFVLGLCKKLAGTATIVSKSQLGDPDFLKSKENVCAVKEKLLRTLYATVNRENCVELSSGAASTYYRFYVASGNNPGIVKSVLKQRWWWTAAESEETANLVWTPWKKGSIVDSLTCCRKSVSASSQAATDITTIRMCNHVEGNVQLGNKKGLYYNLRGYYIALKRDPFLAMPVTFHIKSQGDDEYARFKVTFNAASTKDPTHGQNVWIVKPGENSNRGNGIEICQSMDEVNGLLADLGEFHTKIVQKYIEHPLLYNKRKFDIRCYSLVTALNGKVKGYFYREGYLRTASKEFSLKSLGSRLVHLTNEAVQRNYDEFGKFEPGNKLTYSELQRYLDSSPGLAELHIDFSLHILPQIKRLVTDSMRAVHGKLDPNGRQYTFELFGYDFMIDSEFHVFLIEANINPCLEILSPVTARIVPAMLDSALRIAVDPVFQPPPDVPLARRSTVGDILPEIKHELIYDSEVDAPELEKLEMGETAMELDEGEEEGNGHSEEEEATSGKPREGEGWSK